MGAVKGYKHPRSKIIDLPNVGRCDHSYAYWMKRMKKEDATDNHIVLFFKASRELITQGLFYRPFEDIIRIAIQHGFSCEAEPIVKSPYHKPSLLRTLRVLDYRDEQIASNYSNLG